MDRQKLTNAALLVAKLAIILLVLGIAVMPLLSAWGAIVASGAASTLGLWILGLFIASIALALFTAKL